MEDIGKDSLKMRNIGPPSHDLLQVALCPSQLEGSPLILHVTLLRPAAPTASKWQRAGRYQLNRLR
jgi:hypothetical protein